jgi:hypothetical protein
MNVFLKGAAYRLLKTLFRGVILSEAKDLLFAGAENTADPSDAQKPRPQDDTLQVFQQPGSPLKERPVF